MIYRLYVCDIYMWNIYIYIYNTYISVLLHTESMWYLHMIVPAKADRESSCGWRGHGEGSGSQLGERGEEWYCAAGPPFHTRRGPG